MRPGHLAQNVRHAHRVRFRRVQLAEGVTLLHAVLFNARRFLKQAAPAVGRVGGLSTASIWLLPDQRITVTAQRPCLKTVRLISFSRHGNFVEEVILGVAGAVSAPRDRHFGKRAGAAVPSAVVYGERLTSAMPVGRRLSVPAKITSDAFAPRTADAFVSPSTHKMASPRLDLPEPFGPTIAVTPGANAISVRSANVLKP